MSVDIARLREIRDWSLDLTDANYVHSTIALTVGELRALLTLAETASQREAEAERRGIEWAARWHDEQANRIEAQKEWTDSQSVMVHRSHAAAIRARLTAQPAPDDRANRVDRLEGIVIALSDGLTDEGPDWDAADLYALRCRVADALSLDDLPDWLHKYRDEQREGRG